MPVTVISLLIHATQRIQREGRRLQLFFPYFSELSYFLLTTTPMQAKERLDKHRLKMTSIRQSLSKLTLFNQTTQQLTRKLEQVHKLKKSASFCSTESPQPNFQGYESQSPQKTGSIFQEKYTMGEKIGEGAHGVVKKCYLKQSGKLFAVKSIRLDSEHILFLKRNFTDIKHLHHRNIIEYHALFLEMNKEQCHLIMDYVPFPDLLHISIKSEQQLKEIVYQVLEALTFIHAQKICHRDIKPENILYDEANKSIKIIDFGISKKLMNRGRDTDMLTITGTLYYRAPEMFEGGGYDEMVDLWALGATIYRLMVGCTPFESAYHNETIENIIKGEFAFPPETMAKYSKSARNLVSRLLKKRGERLTAKEALMDIWLIDLYQSADELTKSLTTNGKMLRIFGHSFKIVLQPFQRSTTLSDNLKDLSPDSILNKIKLREMLVQQQDSEIYCEDEPRSL